MSAAFNWWSGKGAVHWPATHNRLVPLCVEGASRSSGRTPPDPDEDSLAWSVAIPRGDAICDDGIYPVTCADCIEWRRA